MLTKVSKAFLLLILLFAVPAVLCDDGDEFIMFDVRTSYNADYVKSVFSNVNVRHIFKVGVQTGVRLVHMSVCARARLCVLCVCMRALGSHLVPFPVWDHFRLPFPLWDHFGFPFPVWGHFWFPFPLWDHFWFPFPVSILLFLPRPLALSVFSSFC